MSRPVARSTITALLPACPQFGNRYRSDHEMTKEGRPGPGAYEAPQAVGKQVQSANPNQPTWKIGEA